MCTKFLQSDFDIQRILIVAHRRQYALTLKLSVSSFLYYCKACIKLTSSFPLVAFRLLSAELTGWSLSRICTSSYKWVQNSSNQILIYEEYWYWHSRQHALMLKLSVSSFLCYCKAYIKFTSSLPLVAFRILSVEPRICTSSYKWVQNSSNQILILKEYW